MLKLSSLIDEDLIKLRHCLEKEEQYAIALNWLNGDLTFKFHSGQIEIHNIIENSEAQEFLLFISRQWGKSYLVVCIALMYCIRNPKTIVRIAAPTLTQASDIVNDNVQPIILDAPPGLVRPLKSLNRWQVGSSQLRLGVLERAHVNSLRGGNAKLIIAEEGGFVKSDDYVYALRSVIGPQLLRSQGKLFHVTTPSEDPLHYIHTEIIPKTKLTNTYFERDIYTNPQLTDEQIDAAAELCGGKDTNEFKREYLVQVVRDPTVIVVPEFDEKLHVVDIQIPEHSYWHTVIDFGGVRDKTAAVIVYYDFNRAKKVVIDEVFFGPNTPTDVIVEGILEVESRYHSFGIDKHNRIADVPGQTQIDLHSLHKFMIIPPVKDEWKAAINQLKVAIKLNEWEIHPRCKFLITSLTSGMFNKQKSDFSRSLALGHCDALAAMMYANRAIDTDNNPYPRAHINPDTQVDLRRDRTKFQDVAAALRPNRSFHRNGRNT